MPQALDNIRILDLGHVLAAPTTSMILADLGAEVIHVEPPWGDDTREFGPFVDGESAYYISINRNKKSIVIDLRQEAGRDVLRDLVRVSDVVLENYRADTMAKLGFAYEELKRLNPRIIYATISGFGRDALPEYVVKSAYDIVAQAYSGIMSITGPEGGPPVRVGASVGDIVAGHQCAIAILSALWYRERTGCGQVIDIAMVDSLIYILENAIVRYTVSGEVPRPMGARHPSLAPFQAFPTADDWLIVAIGNDTLWAKFCVAIGRPDLRDDPRFATVELRNQHERELTPILNEIFPAKSTAEWIEILEAYHLPYSPINTIDQVVHDPNVRYRRMIVEINQPGVGKMEIAGSPFHLSETPGAITRHAPLLGEHTVEVLRQTLSYPPERVQELIAQKVVFAGDR